ncbi:MAG: hypothetical protein WA767_02785, partial [Pseudolabrys sp.]
PDLRQIPSPEVGQARLAANTKSGSRASPTYGASTTFSGSAGNDVDGRHKAGHDSGNAVHVGE